MSYEHVVSPTYIIFKEDSKYLARNGTTGVIEYSSTEPATVFQGAINALGASGGKIFVKRGEYLFNTGVTVNSSVLKLHIQGEGIASRLFAMSDFDLFTCTYGDQFIFSDLFMKHKGTLGSLVKINTGAAHIWFNRIYTLTDTNYNGTLFDIEGGATYNYECSFSDCHINNAGNAGTNKHLYYNGAELWLQNSKFGCSGEKSIVHVKSTGYIGVSNCGFEKTTLYLESVNFFNVDSNRFSYPRDRAIDVYGACIYGEITNNIIVYLQLKDEVEGYGIYLHNDGATTARNIRVDGNIFRIESGVTSYAVKEAGNEDYNQIIYNDVSKAEGNKITKVGNNTVVKDNIGYWTAGDLDNTDIFFDGTHLPNPVGPFYNQGSRREGGFYLETGPNASADGGWDFDAYGAAIILMTGTNGTGYWSLVTKIINGVKYDRQQIGRFRVYIQQDVNQRIWLANCNYVPDNGTLQYTGNHIGFHVTDNLIRGSVANETNQTYIDLQTFTGSFVGTMEYRRFSDKVEFYVNDVLKGTITTNLPSGAGGGLRVTATNYVNAVNRIVQVHQMMYWQSK